MIRRVNFIVFLAAIFLIKTPPIVFFFSFCFSPCCQPENPRNDSYIAKSKKEKELVGLLRVKRFDVPNGSLEVAHVDGAHLLGARFQSKARV